MNTGYRRHYQTVIKVGDLDVDVDSTLDFEVSTPDASSATGPQPGRSVSVDVLDFTASVDGVKLESDAVVRVVAAKLNRRVQERKEELA